MFFIGKWELVSSMKSAQRGVADSRESKAISLTQRALN